MENRPLKIGTRGSPLALIQAQAVEDALVAAHPGLKVERVIIQTSGDWKPAHGEKPLSAMEGGKGLFVKEIEKALIDGAIDCAVHSTKDVPSFLPDDLALDHYLPRADMRDAFICRKAKSFMDLPEGAVVGTASPRRAAFVLSKRPDLKTATLRGNVQTRLDKMDAGLVDAAILAMAGIERLGLSGDFIHPLDTGDMLPACGQGVISIETRKNDGYTRGLLDAVNHRETAICVEIERAALQALGGSCRTAIGAYARFEGGQVMFDLAVAREDGSEIHRESATRGVQSIQDAMAFGDEIASALKGRISPDLLA